MRLDDKVCLITGGTGGIGGATAISFARLGAHLSINGLEFDDAAQRTKSEIEALGRRCGVVIADVGKPEEAMRCVNETLQTHGRIDVLVHCAGGRADGDLLSLSAESWYRAFDVHVHAIFHLWPCRRPLHEGKPRRGNCSGFFRRRVARLQRRDCLRRGQRGDSTVCPLVGSRTGGRQHPGKLRIARNHPHPISGSLTPQQVKNNIEMRIPLHREGRPEDVAEVIVTLVTNDFMTGEAVAIDGGMTMRVA